MSVLKKLFKKKDAGDAPDVLGPETVASPVGGAKTPANNNTGKDAVVAGAEGVDDIAVAEQSVVVDVSAIGALRDGVAKDDATDKKAPAAQQQQQQQQQEQSLQKRRDGGAALYRKLESDARQRAKARGDSEHVVADPTFSMPIPGSAKAQQAVQSHSKIVRSGRLMKEFERIHKSPFVADGTFTVALADDNLFEWDVRYYKFDADSALAGDLGFMQHEYGIDNVWFRLSFPENFPFAPPFMRVLAPLVQGGFVLHGGAICLEILTPQGWVQSCKVDALILQVVVAIAKAGARIVPSVSHEFSEAEARRSYDYLVKTHAKYGWKAEAKDEG